MVIKTKAFISDFLLFCKFSSFLLAWSKTTDKERSAKMESFGLGLALLRLLLTSPILVHTLISMIEKKIERLKAFALGRGISADRVLSPFDYFLLKINCAPIVFWAFYEVMMLFGVLSVIAYIVGVSIGWNTASSGKFLQYGISGCGIGLLIFWVFLYPIKRKLNLRSWNEF